MKKIILSLTILFSTLLCAQPAHYRQSSDGTLLPDKKLTPGAVITTDPLIVCVPGYAKTARKQAHSSTLKASVALYGRKWAPKKEEADHLVSIELGGAPNDIDNLWPQPREKYLPKGQRGAESKDKLENVLHALACTGAITLAEAQREIRTDWVKSYDKHIGAK